MALVFEVTKCYMLHVLYINVYKKKNVICKGWPKIKGAELRKGGRKFDDPKLKGPELKGSEN